MRETSHEEARLRQAMCGLRNMMSERIGIPGWFSYETRVVKFLKDNENILEHYWVFDEDNPEWLRCVVQVYMFEVAKEAFSIRIDEDAWRRFWGLETEDLEEWMSASQQTFGDLAHFILERLGPVDFRPLQMMGRTCEAAGAFRGIEAVANQVDPFVKPFAPSTSVTQRFVGEDLRDLWRRLRWRSENRIPCLRKTVRSRILAFFGTLFGLSVAVMIGASLLFHNSDEYLDVFISCILASIGLFMILIGAVILARIVSPLVARFDSGIPHGIRTFGDLARIIGSRH
ncbi:MAG: hypothetical protein MI923_07600 [Phycisphaerales bacterium]|nr:hypothetical protein [Phycisphaerales bacterium]